MIVLDTNVLSELMRPRPAQGVVAWVDEQDSAALAISAITVAELLYGVARLPDGERKAGLGTAVGALVEEDFSQRVLAFAAAAARRYAEVVVDRERGGRPLSRADAQIAAICLAHHARLATRNGRDFDGTGVELVDPWTAEG